MCLWLNIQMAVKGEIMNVPTYQFLSPNYVVFLVLRMTTRLYHLRIQRLKKQVQIEFPSSVILVYVVSSVIIISMPE
jgi:hypothetical protein